MIAQVKSDASSHDRTIAVAEDLAPLFPMRVPRGRIATFVWQHPTIAIGGLLLFVIVFVAVFAPLLGTVDPGALSAVRRVRAPSAQYWFGTDQLGRDIYSRVLYGARVSLFVGAVVAVISSLLGLAIGISSGFLRWLDPIVMRITDGLMSIPPVLLAIALLGISRGSILNIVAAISLAETPRVARLVRGLVLSLREQAYVDAAVASGVGTITIMWRHILPNAIAPVIVQATFIAASAIITEAILSFIGAGLPSIIPTWGNIMAEGRSLWQVKPYIVFFPAIFLCVTVLSVNLLGDGLRDYLDPRASRRI